MSPKWYVDKRKVEYFVLFIGTIDVKIAVKVIYLIYLIVRRIS